jgi:outer membrane receptor protein involved in Fe transport
MPAFLLIALLLMTSPGHVGLTGTVMSPDRVPIAGATVSAAQDGRQLTAVTNDKGEFSLPDLVLPAIVEVQAARFVTIQQKVDASPAAFVLRPSTVRESLIVSAQTAADTWRQPTTGTTVISGETARDLPGLTSDETLRIVPGLSLFRRTSSRASNPTTHGVTMRGLSASGSSRGLVLLDGTPLNEGFGGWVTWTRLPVFAVGSIDVDRGAQGATFGSDALGGVINMSSPKPDRNQAAVAAAFGDLDTASLDLSGGLHRDALTLFGTAGWFSTDGSIPTAPESRGPVDVPADTEWYNAFGKANYELRRNRLQFTAWGGSDDRGNGTVLQRNTMSGATTAVSWDRSMGLAQLAARVSWSPNTFRQTFSSISSTRATETLTSTQFVDGSTTRAMFEAGRAIPHAFLTARATVNREHAEFTDTRPSSASTLALRDDAESIGAQAAWTPTGSLSFGAGVRTEWRAAPNADASRDRATVGSLTGAWAIGRGIGVRGSIATSHRWPTLNELVRNFQVGAVLTLANPDLLPERARSADAAVTVTRGSWTASAGGFWTVVEDAIANVTISSAPIVRQRRNAGEAHARGGEVDLEVRPVHWARVRASAIFADSKFRDSLEPALEGKWLPQVPRSSFALSGDAQLHWGLTVAGVWRAISEQFDDDRNTFVLAPAYQLDVRLTGRIKMLTWHVTVDNALDNRIEAGRTPLVTLAPPRTFRIGLGWTK